MSDDDKPPIFDALKPIEDMQAWLGAGAQAQRAMLDHMMKAWNPDAARQWMADLASSVEAGEPARLTEDWSRQAMDFWSDNLATWQTLSGLDGEADEKAAAPRRADRRFADPAWEENPVFVSIRRSYEAMAQRLQAMVERAEGATPQHKAQLQFATRGFIEAMSPSNFALTNPAVMRKAIETRGANLLKGLENMLGDIARGQMTHVAPGAFEIGRDIAATPGKVIHETPLYQLIHYAPTTDTVLEVPLVIFPPWINRFYILDLNPAKSFVGWALAQGVSVFMVSWKSADASLSDIVWDDYVAAQIDAVDTIRDALGVDAVHAIGYCVAGTTLAATLALLAARGEADKIRSATFFTAQVDFELAGELRLMTGDEHLRLIETLETDGVYDGRYMAATFNALRGRDLIWNYVVNNYLMGEEYPAFDLLHWNGDVTNLPAKWHRGYLNDLYRDNKLVQPGGMVVDGTPIDLGRITTPAYIQAGREDHIAPPESVWRTMGQLAGPKQFTLAGSGHIAGVVNHPAAGKYQYWTNDDPAVSTLEAFVAGATEHAGSWWPDWIDWLREQDYVEVPATGARIPGKGKRKAIEDAPGRYVKMR